MNKDIFSKKYTILWIIVLLLYAIICACFFFVFLSPLSNANVVEAQVSSLSVNTQYFLDTLVPRWSITSSSDNFSDNGFSGIISRLANIASFDSISWTYYSSQNRVTFYSGSTPTCRLIISNPSGNRYFSSISFYNSSTSTWGDNYSFTTSNYDDSIQIMFSSLGSNVHFRNTFLDCLSVYVPPVVDHRPDLRGLYNYELNGIYTSFDFNTQTTSYSTYTDDLYVFEVYNLDSTQLTAVGTSFYTFEISYSAGHYNSSTDSYTTNSGTFTGYAPYSPSPIGYITIAVDLSYWNLFSIYYPEYANDDDNQLDISYDDSETNLLWRQIKDNYDSIHGMTNDSRSTRSAYLQGYEAGSNADKTLLSVMWQTFNLPFRLLFGTYDDVQSSPTYGQYVGGLFNFTILGVDIRAFCIGIMSFAIVLAVVRFVLGAKGA